MRYFLLLLLCILCFANTYGQNGTRNYGTMHVAIIKEKKPKRIYAKVEMTGPYPDGDSSSKNSLEKKLNETIKLKKLVKAGKYIVSVRYLIEKDGTMADIRCIADPGFDMCQQVMTVLKKQFARWRPQTDSSGKVRQYHTTSTTPQDQ